MSALMLSWTLTYAIQGWSPQPVQVPGFTTEQACKDAAHQFMDYTPPPKHWWNASEGWRAKPAYVGIRCLEVK